ncbi:MAG: cytochrome c biogenesis protein CcsA [bacterium]
MDKLFLYFFSASFVLAGAGTAVSCVFFTFPRKILLSILKYILATVLFTYTVSLFIRIILSRHAPMASLFESLFFFCWSICFISFIVYLRFKESFFLPFSFPMLFLLSLKAYFSPWDIRPLFPALKTIWFELHVAASFFAYSAFGIGFAGGICYLIKNYSRYSGVLPEADIIDLVIYRSAVWGFFLFSFSMLTGGIWAYLAWCNYFIWTPKEIWSVLLWTFYAFYLHARLLNEWSGKRCAWLGILGFIFTMFTYLGVSLLMQSSHRL